MPCSPARALFTQWLLLLLRDAGRATGERYLVYWNTSNPSLQREDFFIEVQINDYLDVSCPHYTEPGPGPGGIPGGGGGGGRPPQWPAVVPETHLIYMVNFDGYSGCEPQGHGFKRWNCNRPLAPLAPLKYSEKFQLFTPFSLGFEFQPGQEYYYISTPRHSSGKKCLRLKVTVCCSANCCSSSCCTPSTTTKMTAGQGSSVSVNSKSDSSEEQADDSGIGASQAAHHAGGYGHMHRPSVGFVIAIAAYALLILLPA